MKGLFRRDQVQSALASILAAYLRFCYATMTWRRAGLHHAEAVWANRQGVIVCFWHSRISLSPFSWPLEKAQPGRALISLSRDGAFVAGAMAELGFPAVRGSTAKAEAPDKAKGGTGAFLGMLKWLKADGAMAVTPDGPRGPAEVMTEGTPTLAKASAAQIIFVGMAAHPCIRLRSWDRQVIPLPFGRGAIAYAEPQFAARQADAKALTVEWQGRLRAVTARAEAMATGDPFSLKLYRLGTRIIQPFAPALLRARARKAKEMPGRIGERMGIASHARPEGKLAWLHAASVGESLSLLPLIDALRTGHPELSLLVTSGTVTSAELLALRLPRGVIHQFVPVDTPGAVGRFLDHWRPDLGVFVESELWPNLVGEARDRGVKLALISARFSQKSLKGWERSPAAARATLSAFDLVLAQDDDAARRLARLGARDDGRLNLKLVGEPLPVNEDALAALRAALGDRPVLLAASTHPGEDEQVLEVFSYLKDRPERPLLVIVPRHPNRGQEVAAIEGFRMALRSAGETPRTNVDVYVADTLGELGLWFRVARAAFIGGSLVDGIGGHNPLEAGRLDCPTASGRHVANWQGVYDDLAAAGAVRMVGVPGLAGFFAEALEGSEALAAEAHRARAMADRAVQSVAPTADRLAELLA